jgi:hypothetical protein
MNTTEEWRDIPSITDYRVSNFGRVLRVSTNKIIKWVYQQRGYPMVGIRCPIRPKRNYLVHRLVGEAFVMGWFFGAQINHKDGNKNNPHADNLEWVTRSENAIHAHRVLGVLGRRRLTEEQSLAVKTRMLSGESPARIADEYAVNISTVYYHKYKSGG